LSQVRDALDAVDDARWRELVAQALNNRDVQLGAQRDAALRKVDECDRTLARTRAQLAATHCQDPQLRAVAARLAVDWKGDAEDMLDTARTGLR
jgi:hypothetical protein